MWAIVSWPIMLILLIPGTCLILRHPGAHVAAEWIGRIVLFVLIPIILIQLLLALFK